MSPYTGRSSIGADAQRSVDDERFEKWLRNIRESHDGAEPLVNDELHWAPLRVPVSEATVALLSSCGVHRRSEPPFDILDPEGDTTIRYLPGDVSSATLMATHGHIDTTSANEDINVVFPIDRLRELADRGRVGRVAATHYGLMGWCPKVARMRDDVAPRIVERLREDGVDALLLVPG